MPKTIRVSVPVTSEHDTIRAKNKLERFFGFDKVAFSQEGDDLIGHIKDHPLGEKDLCHILGKVSDHFGMHKTMKPAVTLLPA